MAHKNTFKFIIILQLLCITFFSLQASKEKTPAIQAKEPAPELIGRVIIPSFYTASKNITKTLKKHSPASSSLLNFSIATLSLKPEFKHINQKKPLQFLAFKNSMNTIDWVTIFESKSKTIDKTIFKNLKFKQINNTIILADSDQLLEQAVTFYSQHPSKPLSSDLFIDYTPPKYPFFYQAVLDEFKALFTNKILNKANHTQETLKLIQTIHALLDYLNILGKDIQTINMQFDFATNNISSKITIIPTPESKLKSFLAAQTQENPMVLLSLLGNYTLLTQGNITLPQNTEDKLSQAIQELYIETKETDQNNTALSKTLEVILSNSKNNFAIYYNKKRFYIGLENQSDKRNAITSYIQKHYPKANELSNFYVLTNNTPINYYCKLSSTKTEIFSTDLEQSILNIAYNDYIESIANAKKQPKKINIKADLKNDKLLITMLIPEEILKRIFRVLSPTP